MAADRSWLLFGRLGRPHGLRGEIVLRPHNPGGVDLTGLSLPLEVSVQGRTVTLTAARASAQGFLVGFEGVKTREAAATLTNGEVALPRAALPVLGEDEFFLEDLLGCEVVDLEGRPRGVVRGLVWNGAQDVLSIEGDGGEWLVPAVPDFLCEVDLEARRVVVDPHE